MDDSLAAINEARIVAYSKAFNLDRDETLAEAIAILVSNLESEELERYGEALTNEFELMD